MPGPWRGVALPCLVSPAMKPERTISRIGRKAIPIPQGVEVKVDYAMVTVNGPKGTLSQPIHPEVIVKVEDGAGGGGKVFV